MLMPIHLLEAIDEECEMVKNERLEPSSSETVLQLISYHSHGYKKRAMIDVRILCSSP